MAKKILALAFLFFPVLLSAQTVRDSTLRMNIFSFHLSGQLLGGDIADRYGPTLGVGGSYLFKTRTNWVFGPDFTFFSSGKFKEESILAGVQDPDGWFITNNGERMLPTINERGFYAGIKLGKIIPVIGPNKNSGLLVTASAGLLQYKTFFRLEEYSIPVMIDEYTKLFDHLTNGFALNEFIGYLHMDNDEPINFYVGFEFHQAWTECRRDWNYDLLGPETKARHDFMYGIRIGWLFPIGKKTAGTYTYF